MERGEFNSIQFNWKESWKPRISVGEKTVQMRMSCLNANNLSEWNSTQFNSMGNEKFNHNQSVTDSSMFYHMIKYY